MNNSSDNSCLSCKSEDNRSINNGKCECIINYYEGSDGEDSDGNN